MNSAADSCKLCHVRYRPGGALDLADVANVEGALRDAGAVVAAAMKGAKFGPTEQVHPVPAFCICCLPTIQLYRGHVSYMSWRVLGSCFPLPGATRTCCAP